MAASLLIRIITLSPRNPLLRSLSAAAASASVEFLVTTCGLSPSAALSAARSLPPSALPNSAAVVSLLRSHHFSPAQISATVTKLPAVLRSRLLPPKLRLLSSAAGPKFIPDLVAANPRILLRSLENHIRPALALILSLSDSPADLLDAVRRNRWLLTSNLQASLVPNIALLISHNVPNAHVSKLLASHPGALMRRHPIFSDAVAASLKFGFHPETPMFVHAVRALSVMRRDTRDARLARPRKWGWSEDDVAAAFRRAPLFLLVSEEKIRRSVEFFVNTVGFEAKELSLQPKLLMYGLDKRIKPRFAVARVLDAKGLLKKGKEGKVFMWMFTCSESIFLERYVMRYSEKVPELMDVYLGRVGVEAFGLEEKGV